MADQPRSHSNQDDNSEPRWEAQLEAERAITGEGVDDDAGSRLYEEATQRVAHRGAEDAEVSFARQMLQLVLIPALIVAGVLGVWLVLVTLTGQSQDLSKVLEELSSDSSSRPQEQERSRMMISLLSYVENQEKLTPEQRKMLVEKLPQIARLRIDVSNEQQRTNEQKRTNEQRAIMGAMAILGDSSFIPVFKEFLDSDNEGKWFAAVSGLHGWRGDMEAVRPLVPELIHVLRRAPRPPANRSDDEPIHAMPAITISVLATAAERGDPAAIEVLAEQLGNATGANRDIAWNARCALAVLGDERGIPGVKSLLDREWLSKQLKDPRDASKGLIDKDAQRKILESTINIVVGFDSRLQGFTVRIDDPGVWSLIEGLAANDPHPDVRNLAQSALAARQQHRRPEVGNEPDSDESDDGGGG